VGAVAIHPRGAGPTRICTEEVGAVAAGVISGSPRHIFFCWLRGFVAAAAAANHPHGDSATRLGAEMVGAVVAGVNGGSPDFIFLMGAGVCSGRGCRESPPQRQHYPPRRQGGRCGRGGGD
jgi:hypothetical protein